MSFILDHLDHAARDSMTFQKSSLQKLFCHFDLFDYNFGVITFKVYNNFFDLVALASSDPNLSWSWRWDLPYIIGERTWTFLICGRRGTNSMVYYYSFAALIIAKL